MSGFPESEGKGRTRFDLAWTDDDGNTIVPIADDAQAKWIKARQEGLAAGLKYYGLPADTKELKERYDSDEVQTEVRKKNKWRNAVLSFKHKTAVFQRYDGEYFERSFEPCVSGRVFEYPKVIEGKQYLVFQTDRGFWFVPCKSTKHLKRMVSSYQPDELGRCPNLLRKFEKSMKEHGGSFYDEITGLPPGTIGNGSQNTYILPDQPDVVHMGLDKWGAFSIDWDDQYWSQPTPYEVSCV